MKPNKFTIHTIERNKPTLLVRDCLSKLRLKWGKLFSINCESEINLDDLLDKFKGIFLLN